MDIPDDLRALVHRWSAPVVTGYGLAWECADCEIVASGMPPDRTALCKGRLVAEIVRLRGLLPESPMPTRVSIHKAASRAVDEERHGSALRLSRMASDAHDAGRAERADAFAEAALNVEHGGRRA